MGYSLVTLGPSIAALAAIGVVTGWRAVRAHSGAGWLLPAALLGTALVQAAQSRGQRVPRLWSA